MVLIDGESVPVDWVKRPFGRFYIEIAGLRPVFLDNARRCRVPYG